MPNYCLIDENTARLAKSMNSYSDYKPDSATAEYRSMVDKAAVIAEEQKARTDPMYHEKIDRLLDTYLCAETGGESERELQHPDTVPVYSGRQRR